MGNVMKEKPSLLNQIARFGAVGGLCFLIDFGLYRLMNHVFQVTGVAQAFPQYYLISGVIGFAVSMVVNYMLSMRYVFVRKDDLARSREFMIFTILSVIGLGVNELCLYIGIDLIYNNWAWLQGWMGRGIAENYFFKFGATGIVMVYNFITRKTFLEKKE